MICLRCGHDNPEGANFCSSCGAPVSAEESDATLTIPVVENRPEGESELAELLEDLPEGVGMVVVSRGPNAGSKYMLDAEVTTAGRHPDSDIFLDDVTVSRRHVEIVRGPAGYRLRDVGSLNGTYVDRERVDERELRYGDNIQVGRYHLVFFVGAHREGGP